MPEEQSERENKKDNESSALSWDKVEAYVNERNTGGAAMAVIETEKILHQVLVKLKFPGETTDQKLRNAKNVIENYQALKLARRVFKKLAYDIGEEIEVSDVKEILTAYHNAIKDLTKVQEKKFSTKERTVMFLRHYFPEPRKTLRRVGISVLVFFFMVFVLDSTTVGQAVTGFFVMLSHFIFSWVLFTILLVAGVIIIVIGGILYFESRKKKKNIRIEK